MFRLLVDVRVNYPPRNEGMGISGQDETGHAEKSLTSVRGCYFRLPPCSYFYYCVVCMEFNFLSFSYLWERKMRYTVPSDEKSSLSGNCNSNGKDVKRVSLIKFIFGIMKRCPLN